MRHTRLILTLLAGSFILACGDTEPQVITETKWVDHAQGELTQGEPGTACAEDGAKTACYFGPEGTEGVGSCAAGSQWCIAGVYTECKKQVLPSEEVCDGVDNNCSGEVDEGLGQTSCGEGACAVTVDTCTDGQLTDCLFEAYNLAAPETCDGLDNDCDGLTDDAQDGTALTQSCYTGAEGTEDVGLCHGGTQTCGGGEWGDCADEVTPEDADICDGLDNNCDGNADEDYADLGAECVVGAGTCENTGSYICNAAGNGVECDVLPGEPSDEVCDGLDNDCDEATDEDAEGAALAQSCYTGTDGTEGVGVCTGGSQTCTEGDWGACDGEVTDSAEACNNLDDDCDGDTDENPDGSALTQSCYTGTDGTAGVGQCLTGTDLCHAGEFIGLCFGETKDVTEVCFNDLDDDCDGAVDEDCVAPCTDEDGDGYGEGCAAGADCDDSNANANAAEPEWCGNDTDDDCDGYTDEFGCANAADGQVLVRFTQTGACTFANLVFVYDFANVGTPAAKTFTGQAGLMISEWNYTLTGGTDGLHRLNVEFDNNGFTGDELMFVETDGSGPVVHDECGTLRLFYEGSEVTWSAMTDPRTDPSPFKASNVFACFGDASGCFLCGGDWDANETPDCDEATDGQCDLNPKDTAACSE